MASQKYSNLGRTTLANSYVSGDASIVVGDASNFPTSGDFMIAVDNPVAFFLKVTAVSGTTFTVSTTAQESYGSLASKASGTSIVEVLTSGTLDNLRSDISKIGVYASLPVTGMKSGDRYRCTDSIYEFVYNGSAWVPFYGSGPSMVQPPSASWSWDNQGSSTIDSTYGYEYLTAVKAASSVDNLRVRYRTAPSAPYTITMAFLHDLSGVPPLTYNGANYVGIACGFRASATGKMVSLLLYYTTTNLWSFGTHKWTTSTSYSALYQETAKTFVSDIMFQRPLWLKIEDDNTNFKFYLSLDGVHWRLNDTRARTDFLAVPDQIFWGAYPRDAGADIALISWG